MHPNLYVHCACDKFNQLVMVKYCACDMFWWPPPIPLPCGEMFIALILPPQLNAMHHHTQFPMQTI